MTTSGTTNFAAGQIASILVKTAQPPDTFYLAAYSDQANPDAGTATELSDSVGYQRIALAWTADGNRQDNSAALDGSNVEAGTVVGGFALVDSPDIGSGNAWFWWNLDQPTELSSGYVIPQGSLQLGGSNGGLVIS